MTKSKQFLIALLVICVLIRVLMWITYEPIITGDTGTYHRAALGLGHLLRHFELRDYNGERTPLYPLLLLGVGFHYKFVWLIQSGLGIGISLLLFALTLAQTQNKGLSFLIGLGHSLSLNELFFEAIIMPETLTSFLMLLSFSLFLIFCRTRKKLALLFCLSLTVSLAGLTRPMTLFLPPLYLLLILFQSFKTRTSLREICKYMFVFTFPVMTTILGWCLVNWKLTGYFGPTTLPGYYLIGHSGRFIELAPEEYRSLRDVYVKFRQKSIAETGSDRDASWMAFKELRKATGVPFVESSKVLTQMSLTLFFQHPDLYLKSVFESYLRFWFVFNYWKPDQMRPPTVAFLLKRLWLLQRMLLITLNFFFFVRIIDGCCQAFIHKSLRGWQSTLSVILIVLSGALVQALLIYGENPRYAIPFQPLILYVVCLWLASKPFGYLFPPREAVTVAPKVPGQ